MTAPDEDTTVRVVTIVTLGAVLLASVVGLTVVAVMTDRDVWRAQVLIFAGATLLALLGGVSWQSLRRHHRWHLRVDRDQEGEEL